MSCGKATAHRRRHRPRQGHQPPRFLTNVNGTLFFSADDGTNGRELWKLTDISDLALTGGNQSAVVANAFGTLLTATVTDQFGNPVSGVTVTFTPPASGPSGTLSGGNTGVSDGNGQVTKTLTANTIAGGPYRIAVSATDGTTTLTGSIDGLVNNPDVAAQLVFIIQPTSTTAGTRINPAVKVQLRDQWGNNVAQAGRAATIRLQGGASLTGTLTVLTDASGVATFSNLALTRPGRYRFVASSPGLTAALSDPFTITPNPAKSGRRWRR